MRKKTVDSGYIPRCSLFYCHSAVYIAMEIVCASKCDKDDALSVVRRSHAALAAVSGGAVGHGQV
jgi:hypothetical protein